VNKEDTNLGFVWKIIMIVLFVSLCFVLCGTVSAESRPQYGEHLCWYSSTKKQCGTYGWSKSEKIAKDAALELCLKKCDSSCVLDYCEKLKRR